MIKRVFQNYIINGNFEAESSKLKFSLSLVVKEV